MFNAKIIVMQLIAWSVYCLLSLITWTRSKPIRNYIIPMYRLWFHGLYGPHCLKKAVKLNNKSSIRRFFVHMRWRWCCMHATSFLIGLEVCLTWVHKNEPWHCSTHLYILINRWSGQLYHLFGAVTIFIYQVHFSPCYALPKHWYLLKEYRSCISQCCDFMFCLVYVCLRCWRF